MNDFLKNISNLLSDKNDVDISDNQLDKIDSLLNSFLKTLYYQDINSDIYKDINELSRNSMILSIAAENLDFKENLENLQSYYLGYLYSILQLKNISDEYNDIMYLSNKVDQLDYMSEILEELYTKNRLDFDCLYNNLTLKYSQLKKSSFKQYLNRHLDMNLYSKITDSNKKTIYIITYVGRDVYINLKQQNDISPKLATDFILTLLDTIKNEINNKTYSANNIYCNLIDYRATLPITKPKLFREKVSEIMEVARPVNQWTHIDLEVDKYNDYIQKRSSDLVFIDLNEYSEE
jgi:hypothetical protein